MKKFNIVAGYFLLATLIFLLSSCEAIGAIFKAGIWVGVLGVLIIIAIIFWLISKAGKK